MCDHVLLCMCVCAPKVLCVNIYCRVCVCVRMHMNLYVCTCIDTYVCVLVCVCVYGYVCVGLFVFICVYMYRSGVLQSR
jgi:hypothetical protein